eukprot:g29342.t1
MEKLETELPTAGSEPEAEPQDGPQVTSRLGPVRSGDGRTKSRFEGYAWQEWRQRPPDGVILVPTSEVAQQVQEQIKPLASAGRVQVAGGTAEIGAEAQEKELSRAGVLVLTPWQLQCQSWALGKDEDLVALNQERSE